MNPTIECRMERSKPYLFLYFDGHLSEDDTMEAILKIISLFKECKGKTTMVWECTRMTGYDEGSREMWQEFMKDIRTRLEEVHLISQNVLIRVGGSVVGMFAGMKITTWSSIEEFQAKH